MTTNIASEKVGLKSKHNELIMQLDGVALT